MPDDLANIEFDREGFMVEPNAWSAEVGATIARRAGLELTDRHWIVINFAREEFAANGEAPTLRRITKKTKIKLKEIYALFPGGAAKVAAKVAGLGKPAGCL